MRPFFVSIPTLAVHNEQKNSWLAFGRRKLPSTKAIMHKSVYRRFEAGPVVLFDMTGKYRPVNVSEHVDFVQYYDPNIKDPQPANPAQAMADDIEGKWNWAKSENKTFLISNTGDSLVDAGSRC
jgi:hypothetical protein